MARRDETSFEAMIGRALLGDDKEKELQFIRIDCKHYAMNKMFCDCGNILDQKKIQLLKNDTDRIVAVCCEECRKTAENKLKAKDLTGLIGWTWSNWDWKTSIVHVAE